MQLYPGWSARDNYGAHNKKKLPQKRKREHSIHEGHIMKPEDSGTTIKHSNIVKITFN